MNELTLAADHPSATRTRYLSGRARLERAGRERTCVGCRRACASEDLVRMVMAADGTLRFDLEGGAWGRGAWIHPRCDCFVKSVRGLGRAFHRTIIVTAGELHEALVTTAWRKVARLIDTARRSGKLATRLEAVEQTWEDRSLALLLLADEAKLTAMPTWFAQAGAAGRVLMVPGKSIPRPAGTPDIELAAITESRLATEIARNVAIAQIPPPTRIGRGSDKGTEVG